MNDDSAIDVLCVGHAAYDLIFSVPHHPGADEKCVADGFAACGGGPAANAAITVAHLGGRAAFAGYLGRDLFGDRHREELLAAGVDCSLLRRGDSPTPLSTILVKPDGHRALVNYRGDTAPLPADALDPAGIEAKSLLFDGHEPLLSPPLAAAARRRGIPTVLDAGSLHPGTRALMGAVDYLVASEKFAYQLSGGQDPQAALEQLAELAPTAVITLGERGLIWAGRGQRGALPAFPVTALDTTGAGDIFHGAFAACIARAMDLQASLRLASAAAALGCTRIGARTGIPTAAEVERLLNGG